MSGYHGYANIFNLLRETRSVANKNCDTGKITKALLINMSKIKTQWKSQDRI